MSSRGRTAAWVGGFALLVGLAAIPALYDFRHHGAGECDPIERRVLPDEPARAARLADALADDPTLADCTLSRHGMTRSDYIDLMDRISDDHALSSAYAEARRTR